MMKKRGISLALKIPAYFGLAVMVLVLTAACSNPMGTPVGEGRVTVQYGISSRTLLPDSATEVSSYRVTFLHENGIEVVVDSQETFVETSLPSLGSWDILVEGFDGDNLLVVTGSTVVDLDSDQTRTVAVTLTEANGSGLARFEVQWNSVQIRDAVVEGSLIDTSGYTIPMGFSTSPTGEAVSEIQVDDGFYTLEARLLDGSTVVAGFAEAVLISTGGTTQHLFSFDTVNKPGEPISVSGESFTVAWDAPIDPATGEPQAVDGYKLYYRVHGTYGWSHVADTGASVNEYTITTAELPYGEYEFAVASVNSATESELHTSFDDTADPTYGWYVVWG